MSDKLQSVLDSPVAIEEFKAHCFMNMQEESCGLFVLIAGAMQFVPCENIAYDKKNSFLINPADFVKVSDQGDVMAVGHSHVVGTSKPSGEDVVHSTNCQLPFVIFQPEALTLDSLDVSLEPAPLIGRTWSLGVSDCYTLVRDYFKGQGLVLKDYVRTSLQQIIDENMFVTNFAENDFTEVFDGPKMNDIILIQIHADVPNHIAVMIDDSLMLHHLQNRLSCREPWGGYWRKHALMILRHAPW